MYENPQNGGISDEIYEDPEDLLDRIYENLQECLFSYEVWIKTFLEGQGTDEARSLILDYVKEEMDFFSKYLRVRTHDVNGSIKQIEASIRRFSISPLTDRPQDLK